MHACRVMAAIGKADPLPFVHTLNPDQRPVLKLQFWPNKQYGAQAAIITTHGCWILNCSSSQPGINLPSSAVLSLFCLSIHSNTGQNVV